MGYGHNDGYLCLTATGNLEKIQRIGATVKEIYQAQIMEGFTDHDTAAAIDFIKLRLVQELPELEKMMELVGLANTSEDTMGNVFGLILNELVYGHFIPSLLDFCENIIAYVDKYEAEEPLMIPEFTHDQPAEVTTLGKKFLTRFQK